MREKYFLGQTKLTEFTDNTPILQKSFRKFRQKKDDTGWKFGSTQRNRASERKGDNKSFCLIFKCPRRAILL